jgi:hypothetical protein
VTPITPWPTWLSASSSVCFATARVILPSARAPAILPITEGSPTWAWTMVAHLCVPAFACWFFCWLFNFVQIACTRIGPSGYLRWWYSSSGGEVGQKIEHVLFVVPPARPMLLLHVVRLCSWRVVSYTSVNTRLLLHAAAALAFMLVLLACVCQAMLFVW